MPTTAAASPSATAAAQGSSPSPPATAPLSARLSKLVLSLQFLWFLGHVLTVFQAGWFILVGRFFGGSGNARSGYTKALWGVLLSYGIIIFKSHGIPQISRAHFQRIMMDENSQYFMLALAWVSSKPIWIILVPYFVFSIFQTINYTRAEILPVLFPPSSPLHKTISARVSPAILNFSRTYQVQALRIVAYLEVWAMLPYLTFSILTGHVSLMMPVLYAMFLRFKFFQSPVTREAFGELKVRLDGIIETERSPLWAKAFYRKAVDAIVKFGDVETTSSQQR